MKNLITLFALLLGAFTVFSQDPAIIWQNTIGGDSADFLITMEPTADGGHILGGHSFSDASGDKTEDNTGPIAIWIVKIDDSGTIQWQNTIGGDEEDYVNVVKQTTDGGYIVLGGSNSGISGDKTEDSRGGLDFWILKLDGSGTIVWQHTYGGAQNDFETYGQQTSDGGYIVGGYSDSDVSGDKTAPSNGGRDYWVLKLDSTGNITWQKTFGGSLVDRVGATLQTADGGYILGGFSDSPVSGNKTENSQGSLDFWIVKLDSTGNITWQNTIGGSNFDVLRDLIQTSDGGYIAAGYSSSDTSGDKTEDSRGDVDYWIVKLDATGNITWQKTFGGQFEDSLRDVKQLANGSYVVAGFSSSGISGDKTENRIGGYDYWLLRLNTSGNLVSQNTIGGNLDESDTYISPTSDGNFVMASTSSSDISGDKGENSEGANDYWVFKTTSAILGVPLTDFGPALAVYPNPTSGAFTIDLGESVEEINTTITNILGQVVASEIFENTKILEFTMEDAAGIYFVKVSTPDGLSETIKVVKE